MREIVPFGRQIAELNIGSVKCEGFYVRDVWESITSTFPNLTTLNTYGAAETSSLSDDTMLHLAEVYPSMQYLHLAFRMSDNVASFHQLRCRELRLSNNSNCILLSQSCPLLETLIVRGNRDVTDEGIVAIVQGCPLLSDFTLWELSAVTNASLQTIAIFCPRLKDFGVINCEGVDLVHILHLVQAAKNLLTLHIRGNSFYPGLYLSTIRKPCDVALNLHGPLRLRVVDMKSVGDLSDSILHDMTRNCPDLTSVEISVCLGER